MGCKKSVFLLSAKSRIHAIAAEPRPLLRAFEKSMEYFAQAEQNAFLQASNKLNVKNPYDPHIWVAVTYELRWKSFPFSSRFALSDCVRSNAVSKLIPMQATKNSTISKYAAEVSAISIRKIE